MNESCILWMNESCPIQMSHVTCTQIDLSRHISKTVLCLDGKVTVTNMKDSCHTWMSHDSYEWVMSHVCRPFKHNCPVPRWKCRVTHMIESCLNESCHMYIDLLSHGHNCLEPCPACSWGSDNSLPPPVWRNSFMWDIHIPFIWDMTTSYETRPICSWGSDNTLPPPVWCIYIYIYIHIYMYIYIYMCIYMCVHICIYINIYTYEWVMFHINESCPIWTNYVHYFFTWDSTLPPPVWRDWQFVHMGHDSFIWDTTQLFVRQW